jgi:hypothetical protein
MTKRKTGTGGSKKAKKAPTGVDVRQARAAMEGVFASMFGGGRSTPLDQAQELIYAAWEELPDALLLVVRQRVHRVHEDGGEPVLLEAPRVLDSVLQGGQEETLRLARSGSRRHDEGRRVRGEQVVDGVRLVQERRLGVARLLHRPGERCVEPQLAPRLAVLEGAMRLEERVLREEERLRERRLERLPQLRVARAKLRAQVVRVFVGDPVDDADGMDGHACSARTTRSSSTRLPKVVRRSALGVVTR